MLESRPASIPPVGPNHRSPRWRTWLIFLCTVLALAIVYEVRTSRLQSSVLARYAARVTYDIGTGPSSSIVFPSSGPQDRRLGYSSLPEFTDRLLLRGYRIAEQAQMSEPMAQLASLGIAPPYREKTSGGLVVRGASGTVLFDARPEGLLFERYEDVPPLIVASLLFIEDRELLDGNPRHNPALDWERLSRAWLLYFGRGLGLPLATEGGSTLATQIEKLYHSPGGRTSSPLEKLQQVTAATLRAYRSGPDTLAHRRDIVVDYLNSMPLAAVPDHGEVRGLGEGLRAWFGLDFAAVQRSLMDRDLSEQKVAAYKAVLALLCAVREPTRFLVQDRAALEERLNAYTRLFGAAGVLSPELAERVERAPLQFRTSSPSGSPGPVSAHKGVAAVRTELLDLLNVAGLYELDRLDLEVESTIDVRLQSAVRRLLTDLHDPTFIASHALSGKHLLSQGNPADVTYTVLLYEATPEANVLRVQADSLDQPFDLNTGMKMGLGSTAKLRTLAHYLEVVAQLHAELTTRNDRSSLVPHDPITAWALELMKSDPSIGLDDFLQRALERDYPAEPRRVSFAADRPTQGGLDDSGSIGSVPSDDTMVDSDLTDTVPSDDTVVDSDLADSVPSDDTEVDSDPADSVPIDGRPADSNLTDGSVTSSSEPDVPDLDVWYIPRSLSLRTALIQSSNRVFTGLMRDLVRYHAARLPYDAEAVLTDPDNPLRRRFLEQSADEEARFVLKRAYRSYRGLDENETVRRLLRGRVSASRAAVLFYAWQTNTAQQRLTDWLGRHVAGMPGVIAGTPSADTGTGAVTDTRAAVLRLARAYGNPRLTIADYGYLLDLHPLEIWCAGELLRRPGLSFEDLTDRADGAVQMSSEWLFRTRNRKAQDLRLKRRIERDAFVQMTPYWRRMGFPFERLVPSVTTALGASSDRPAALAELMGIIVNDGRRRPSVLIDELRFADRTPYDSVFRAQPERGEQVMQPAVARLLRGVLAEVVEYGTARPLKAAIIGPDGAPARVGGKTGTDSGDTRHEIPAGVGASAAGRALDRTASFVFYVGDRYFGVITASVEGATAADYRFTSELPLAMLRLLAPMIEQRLAATDADGSTRSAGTARDESSTDAPTGTGRRQLTLRATGGT
jgi:membrane peptidoglycan carboxypeptidase